MLEEREGNLAGATLPATQEERPSTKRQGLPFLPRVREKRNLSALLGRIMRDVFQERSNPGNVSGALPQIDTL